MMRFVAGRLVQALPVTGLVSVVVFSIIHLVPGDPAHVMLGPNALPEQLAALRAELGLDRPLPVQYAVWVARLLRGDFGHSYLNGFPVTGLLGRAWPVTLQLTLAALGLAMVLAVSVAFLAVRFRHTWIDHAVITTLAVAYATPTFWVAILLVFVFSVRLGWLPPSGYVSPAEGVGAALRTMAMPAFALGLGVAAVLARFLRAAVLEELGREYVRTAWAKGATERAVLYRHAMRNALIPVVTILGLQFGTFMGGAVLTEAIFGIPGVGRLLWNSVLARDYAVVQATILWIALLFVVINLLTDLSYALLDPRIRYQ
jgi:peptide/nickel transport system permease protein